MKPLFLKTYNKIEQLKHIEGKEKSGVECYIYYINNKFHLNIMKKHLLKYNPLLNQSEKGYKNKYGETFADYLIKLKIINFNEIENLIFYRLYFK